MKQIIIIFTVIFVGCGVVMAENQKSNDFKCPKEIKVYSKVQHIPKGWMNWDVAEEGKNAVKKLLTVSLYEGHPVKKMVIAPAKSEENFWSWSFAPFGENRKSPIWIACQYEDTQILIVQSLSTKVSNCRMEFAAGAESKKIGTISCN